jgi:urease accessory protein UreE
LTIIDQTFREDALPPSTRGYARDTITLGWEDRLHVRGPRRADGGVAFGLSLPRGTILRGGDCLVVDEAKTVVVVAERPEPVFLIEPRASPRMGSVRVPHRQSAPAADDHRNRNRLP